MKKGIRKKTKAIEVDASYQPLETMIASTETRRNAAATIKRTDEFINIENGIVPFKNSSNKDYHSCMDVRDAVILCQKAYYNFSIFRNTIDLMTEFSSSNIFFKNGNKASRDFFTNYYNKTNINSLQDRFFREYYRSGNVFIYKMKGSIKKEDILKLNKVYGGDLSKITAEEIVLPIRYVILNPADIKVGSNISFANSSYYKVLSDYELERLRKPRTQEDKEILSQLPLDIINKIKNARGTEILLPLENESIVAVFYKKQDYEPFAVPMGYPVLSDINWKTEMKKMDMAVMRTMNQVILLITMGAEPDKGGINQRNIETMQQFFKNESVARVLVADYTTKAEWKIPDIANLLDPKKYEIVDRDIKEGLNNLLVNSEDKFANASVKIEVFVERLRQARQSFLNEFLIPEIKNISKEMGFKVYPTPYFEDIDLKDNLEYSKIYTRLGELGILTPAEVIESIENGRLPSPEESLENQKQLRLHKDEGFFEPIVGGPYSQKELQKESNNLKLEQQKNAIKKPAGRPSGTKQSKKPGLVGFSIKNLTSNLSLASTLEKRIENYIKDKYKIKKLSSIQVEASKALLENITSSILPDEWEKANLEDFINIEKPKFKDEIENISLEHNIPTYEASLLFHSKAI